MKKRNFEKRNQNRVLAPAGTYSDQAIMNMIESVKYSGNPVHKKHRGDFGLIPPAIHRPGKGLCDLAGIFRQKDALALVKKALELGTVSTPGKGGWPKRIWAVAENGTPLEALPDSVGSYHGYPLTLPDPVLNEVIEMWKGKK